MNRIRLIFQNIQRIEGSDGCSLIMLTNEEGSLALSVICDQLMTEEIMVRLRGNKERHTFLPETLVQLLEKPCELMVFGLHNGQYQTVLATSDYQRDVRIRMSDAVLLSIISDIPIYIEEELFRRQCVPYEANSSRVAIPINTMDREHLSAALQQAIDVENYEMACKLRDELTRRKEAGA